MFSMAMKAQQCELAILSDSTPVKASILTVQRRLNVPNGTASLGFASHRI
jgi:hypothetical protein